MAVWYLPNLQNLTPVCNNIDGQQCLGFVVDIQIDKESREKLYLILYDDNDMEHSTTEETIAFQDNRFTDTQWAYIVQ